jgi:5-amino-6-(5-phosphoribosylamino)uracil reductase
MNLAITADGRIATANRQITSFGSRRDLTHLFNLRAAADAVMCGAQTVREGPINLDAGPPRFQRLRLRRGLAEQPTRVVVSGSCHLPDGLRILQPSPAPLIVLTTSRAPLHRLSRLESRGVHCARFGRRELDLKAALQWLRTRHDIRRLLVEGGSQLNASLLRAGLVDELYLTLCPIVFGGSEGPTLANEQRLVPLTRAVPAKLCSVRRVGAELFLKYTLR